MLDEPSSNLDPASLPGAGRDPGAAGRDRADGDARPAAPMRWSCARGRRILSGGVIAADGPTRELLADRELREAHRLELPYGYALPDCEALCPAGVRGPAIRLSAPEAGPGRGLAQG
ncbi:hypothetical protein ACU686_06555 [Yinghuangia aomiensis]